MLAMLSQEKLRTQTFSSDIRANEVLLVASGRMKIGDRIRKCRNLKGWSYAEVARQLLTLGVEITPEVVSLYEKHKTKPGRAVRKALATLFGVTEAYLEFGPQVASESPDSPTEEELDLIAVYRDCDPEIQQVVEALLEAGRILASKKSPKHKRKSR